MIKSRFRVVKFKENLANVRDREDREKELIYSVQMPKQTAVCPFFQQYFFPLAIVECCVI